MPLTVAPVRADRLLSLLMLLQAHGRMTAPALAAALEVSTRTVYRDVTALSAAGVPVYAERGAQGGIALVPGYRTDMTGLTGPEAQALFAFTGSGAVDDLGRGDALANAVRKLLAALPAAQRPAAERVRQRVLVDTRRWQGHPDALPHLGTLQEAVLADRRVRLRYQGRSRDRPRDYDIEPWGLVAQAGTWYLLAGTERGQRIFRVARVSGARLLDQTFERPEGFNLRTLWDQARSRFRAPESYWVTVRVEPDSIGLVERTAGPRLLSPIDVSGADPAVFRMEFGADYDAESVLLGYGARLEVLDPPELRERLAAAAAALTAIYRARALDPT